MSGLRNVLREIKGLEQSSESRTVGVGWIIYVQIKIAENEEIGSYRCKILKE